jgi:hypothetical protein
MTQRDGYVAAVVGSVVGCAVLAGVGLLPLLIPCNHNDGFGCLGPAIAAALAVMAGGVIGSLLGCYLALRIQRHRKAGRTFGYLVLLALLATGLAFTLVSALGHRARSLGFLAILAPIVLPLPARWLALKRRSQAPVEI